MVESFFHIFFSDPKQWNVRCVIIFDIGANRRIGLHRKRKKDSNKNFIDFDISKGLAILKYINDITISKDKTDKSMSGGKRNRYESSGC